MHFAPGSGLGFIRKGQFVNRPAAFGIHHRVLAVGGESRHRGFLDGQVRRDILHACFFAGSEDDPHRAIQLHAAVPHGLQGIQAGEHRSFVVQGAPGIDPVVPDRGFIRRGCPFAFGANHIQVTHHADIGFSFGALRFILRDPHLIEHRFRGKSQGLCQLHGFFQGLAGAGTIGSTGFGFSPFAVDGKDLEESCQQRLFLCLRLFEQGRCTFLVHDVPLSYFRTSGAVRVFM